MKRLNPWLEQAEAPTKKKKKKKKKKEEEGKL
jgi:hypothetical protein